MLVTNKATQNKGAQKDGKPDLQAASESTVGDVTEKANEVGVSMNALILQVLWDWAKAEQPEEEQPEKKGA